MTTHVDDKLWNAVVDRDTYEIWRDTPHTAPYMTWRRTHGQPFCIVELIMPELRPMCSGRTTLDHVKDEPMMGKRAPSDEAHLVVMCYYHNVAHPPSKELRARERIYLASFAFHIR